MRLAVRWRLTAAFAAVIAVVLAATGLFVYESQRSNLDQTIDRALRARAADVAALAQQSDTGLADARPRGRAARVQLAQLIDHSVRVIDSTPGLPRHPLLSPPALAVVRNGGSVMIGSAATSGRQRRNLEQRSARSPCTGPPPP
jgi:hypothetical protein